MDPCVGCEVLLHKGDESLIVVIAESNWCMKCMPCDYCRTYVKVPRAIRLDLRCSSYSRHHVPWDCPCLQDSKYAAIAQRLIFEDTLPEHSDFIREVVLRQAVRERIVVLQHRYDGTEEELGEFLQEYRTIIDDVWLEERIAGHEMDLQLDENRAKKRGDKTQVSIKRKTFNSFKRVSERIYNPIIKGAD